MNRIFRLRVLFASLAVTALAVASVAFAQLDVASHPDLGDHLVTDDGFVLYVFLPDQQGASTCYDGCASAWPPLLADGDVMASDAVDTEQVGTVERNDGSMQITYFGWPLYTFARDSEPGMASGQGAGENWYVIAPDGTVVGADMGNDSGASGSNAMALSQEEYDALYNDGIRAYRSTCAQCHGRNGDEALVTHTIILAENDDLADAALVINQVIHGNGYMPGFGDALDDRQVAAVVTYVRNSWGNDYGPVLEEDIAQYR